MKFEPQFTNETTRECRALVPLTLTVNANSRGYSLPDAAFLTQLAANKNGFLQYRAKRREQPEVGAERYRNTIADALACRPSGTKLNYCA
ncbi:MAG: hypothetical protein KF835_09170 [Xanthobacteraceae bacterium]|nr:hypothetical protein [Xanthobacteraceae bacterium]